MKSEWQRVKLGEVAEILLGKMLDHKKNHGKPMPYLNNVAVRWGSFDLSSLETMPFEEDEIDRYQISKGDIVVCEGGECGRCAIWKDASPIQYQKALHRVRTTAEADQAFIYYQLCHIFKSGKADALLTGSTIKHLPRQTFINLEISLPPLPTQRRIAAVLGALDDKIELNRKMNANLEAQAQALFKSWFVDFAPWGGKMPKGWKKGSLLDIAEYTNGLAMQKFRPIGEDAGLPVLKIKELGQGSIDADSEKCSSDIDSRYVVENGDVIFSWSGTLLVDIWCGGKCGLNQHLFKVTSDKYGKWFVYLWTKHYQRKFAALAAAFATTMGHIKRSELEKAEVAIPDKEFYEKTTKQIEPLIDLMVQRREESRKLAELRDTLLPKLMSGELEVAG